MRVEEKFINQKGPFFLVDQVRANVAQCLYRYFADFRCIYLEWCA